MLDAVRSWNVPGFFPTPASVVDRMIEAADINPDERYDFLEPSAGIGSIAERLQEHVAKNGGTLTCVELSSRLCEILIRKGLGTAAGCAVSQGNFLTETFGRGRADRILMNPPFENRADRAHVTKAIGWLPRGGKLVALMTQASASAVATAFGHRPDLRIEVENLPPNSFTGPEAIRQTGVAVAMLTVRRQP
jgi:predicted RNA methylase